MTRTTRTRLGSLIALIGLVVALPAITPTAHAQSSDIDTEVGVEEAGVEAGDAVPGQRIVHDEQMIALPSVGRSLTQIAPLEVSSSALTAAPVCDDGTSGNRVQAIYVRGASQTDTYDASVQKIRQAMVFADGVVDNSVADREMHLRMVHAGAPNCAVSVLRKVVPDSVASDIQQITQYLTTQPEFQDPHRKYVAFAEVKSSGECGIAFSWADDSPGGGNLNNGYINVDSNGQHAAHATVGRYCWDVSYAAANPDAKAIAAAHETFHMLGAVSRGAPHATQRGHCTDENDIMCYVDGSGVVMSYDNGCGGVPANPGTLDNTAPENFLLDCNDDDYFDPSRPRPTDGYLGSHWNTADSDFLYGNDGDRFVALPNPRRALDSRSIAGRLDQREVPLDLVGASLGIADDATAVVLNVTAVDPTAQMNLTVWPTGLPKPLASNLNVTPGNVIANQVTVKLGAGGARGSGSVSLSTNTGQTDVVVDVIGYYRKSRAGDGSELQPVSPYRVLSSRDRIGAYSTPWGQGQTRAVRISGVPAAATAVVLNVTATESTAARSHLRVFPHGQALPTASSINFEAGVNTPNLVTVGLVDGQVDIYNHAGSVHVLADVVGYYGPGSSTFVPVANERVLDSRSESRIGSLTRWGPRTTQVLHLGGVATVPANATAVVLNVTGVGATSNTNLRLFPAASKVPDISNLNLLGGGTPRPNAVVVGLNGSGNVAIYNYAGNVDVVADVVGYFIPS